MLSNNNIMEQKQSIFNSSIMDPRISFSNDFADAKEGISKYREAPVSSDFEFSVRNYSMIPADEIFCQGKILPLKDESSNQLKKTTLRDELMVDDEDEYEDEDDEFDPFCRMQKSSGWWKLKRGHLVFKKGAERNNNGVLHTIAEEKRTVKI